MGNKEIAPSSINGKSLAYQYDEKIAIIRGQEPDFENVMVGFDAKFTPEPNNPYDKKAISVFSNEIKLGYLYKGKLQEMVHDYIRRGDPVYSYISNIDPNKKTITLFIGFYKELESEYEKLIKKAAYKTFRLTGNKSEEFQDNIMFLSSGEEIDHDYDYEKDKYAAFANGGEVGFFPKSATDLLENGCKVFIDEISENENADKYDISVAIFLEEK